MEIAGILPQLADKTGSGEWSLVRRPLRRRDCMIYFLRSASGELPVMALKIYRKDTVGKNLVRHLHKKSRKLHKAATPEFTIPRPVLFVQAENALVMEYVEAPLAGSLLMKGFHSKEKRHDVIRKSAAWLRWFHEHSGVMPKPFDAESFTLKLDKTREKIRTVAPYALQRDRCLDECLGHVRRVAAEIDGVLLPHATAHGDFTPFNLFIAGGTTIGFDYRANRNLPVYHDICRFLLYLDVYRIVPAPAADLKRFGCRGEDLEVFMDAYAPDGGMVDEALWLKLHFLEITRRIISLTLPRAKARNPLFRFIEMSHLHRNARHILGTLKSNG